MRYAIAALVVIAAHFSLTAFAPAEAGKAWAFWPFAADSRPILAGVGGLPQQPGSALAPMLAGLAGVGFILALLGLFDFAVPLAWWRSLVVAAAAASILLYLLFLGRWSALPIALDGVLVWLAVAQPWPLAG
jgi:hypothetical protein